MRREHRKTGEGEAVGGLSCSSDAWYFSFQHRSKALATVKNAWRHCIAQPITERLDISGRMSRGTCVKWVDATFLVRKKEKQWARYCGWLPKIRRRCCSAPAAAVQTNSRQPSKQHRDWLQVLNQPGTAVDTKQVLDLIWNHGEITQIDPSQAAFKMAIQASSFALGWWNHATLVVKSLEYFLFCPPDF